MSSSSRILTGLLSAGLALLVLEAGAAAQELNWAQKMFEKQRHDFGVVARGADVRYDFKWTNLYKEPVHIAGIRTTCGCTAGKPSKDTLQSLEVGHIEVTMNTQRFSRQKDSNLIVTFDQPLFAEVTLPISAYIRTDVVLTPGSAAFGAIDQGLEATRKIEVAYAGRSNWTINSIKCDNPHLSATVVEKRRENGRVDYELMVGIKPTAPVGNLRDQIYLVTDDANNPHVPVIVEARVEADITVTPSLVSLGMLVPGQEKTVNVVLRGKRPFAIEKIECETDQEAFKVRLPDMARPVHVLPLTVTPPDRPGEFTEEFTVTVAGRPDPIVFKAYGRIVEPGGAQ